MKVIIFIPCFFCEKQISRLLKKIDFLPKEIFEVLIIDNNSSDETIVSAQKVIRSFPIEIRQRFTLVKNYQNYNLGGSFKLAIKYALEKQYTHMIIFHGDDQACFSDITSILRKTQTQSLDACFGARFMPGALRLNYSIVRYLGNILFNIIFSCFLGRIVWDIGSGVNCYRLSSLPLDDLPFFPDHLAFDLLLLFHFCQKRYSFEFTPIRWEEKDQTSNVLNIKIGALILKILFAYKIGLNLLSDSAEHKRGFVVYET